MTLEEKIGQLFINHNNDYSPEYLDGVLDSYHVGGMRYRPGPLGRRAGTHPLRPVEDEDSAAVASNPEMGGAGSCDDGTFVSTHLQAGSHPDKAIARQMGHVAGVETAALGCNWAFAPIVDIHYNWRNTVISTRSFGNTPEIVVERAKEYFDGISESPTVCAMKHFPGDGVDERDQHVVTSYNTLGYERVEPDVRPGVPGNDRPRRAVHHGRPHRRAGAVPALPARAWRTRTSCRPPWRRSCCRTCSAASSGSTG